MLQLQCATNFQNANETRSLELTSDSEAEGIAGQPGQRCATNCVNICLVPPPSWIGCAATNRAAKVCSGVSAAEIIELATSCGLLLLTVRERERDGKGERDSLCNWLSNARTQPQAQRICHTLLPRTVGAKKLCANEPSRARTSINVSYTTVQLPHTPLPRSTRAAKLKFQFSIQVSIAIVDYDRRCTRATRAETERRGREREGAREQSNRSSDNVDTFLAGQGWQGGGQRPAAPTLSE